jgi:membrane dipeptidase
MPLDLHDARALHDQVPVIDLHADTPKLMDKIGFDITVEHKRPLLPRRANYVGHVDLPRMHRGGVAAQIFGLWTFPYPERGCAASIHAQLDAMDATARRAPEQFRWSLTPEQIRATQKAGGIAVLAGIEGGQALESRVDNVEAFARRGVRYCGLLHFSVNSLGTPAAGRGANHHDGLTAFGRDVVREMNRVGMVIDLAHINRPGFFEALELTKDPVMVSHTGVTGVHEHWRNIDDRQLRAVADNGGCVGIIFAERFLGGKGIDAVCDHIVHIVNVAGEDVPALGSDFDGFIVPPVGLEDISRMPHLTAALSRRGLGETALKKILGENALRVLGAVPPRVPVKVPTA